MTIIKKLSLWAVPVLLVFTLLSADAHAQRRGQQEKEKPPPVLWGQGLDPMSFRLQGQAFYGRPQLYYKDDNANMVFFFISEENMQAFLDGGTKLENLLPRYNGWDAYGMSFGELYPGALNIFEVHDDKVYMFYSFATRRAWQQDREKFIERADEAFKKYQEDVMSDPEKVI